MGAISCFLCGVTDCLDGMVELAYRRSSSVAPSIFFRVSIISSESLWNVISSRGLIDPKTSLTAVSTFVCISRQPLCSSHQLKARKLRLVSKSAPSTSLDLLSS